MSTEDVELFAVTNDDELTVADDFDSLGGSIGVINSLGRSTGNRNGVLLFVAALSGNGDELGVSSFAGSREEIEFLNCLFLFAQLFR